MYGFYRVERFRNTILLTIELDISGNSSDAEILAKVREVVGKADDFHRASGGHGLKVESVEVVTDVIPDPS